jgi:hypothetical protein
MPDNESCDISGNDQSANNKYEHDHEKNNTGTVLKHWIDVLSSHLHDLHEITKRAAREHRRHLHEQFKRERS